MPPLKSKKPLENGLSLIKLAIKLFITLNYLY
jgi:hypothetical protein